ncbi:MAG: 2OG-Fe(II) oxygenase, partial [Myxococcota bacterium]
VDATLRESSGVEGLLPQWVSVLHLRAPSHGGQLELWRGDQCLASLEPRPGRILHFRGELIHGVREVATDSSRSRLSLVCEQYWISHQALNRIPRYRTHSKAGFHALVTPPGS